MSDQRHERQIRLSEVGIDGQRRISQARVALVGCGGLAAGSLPALVGAGIGYIRLIDDDLVAESNLHRQMLFTEEDLGHPKAEVAAALFFFNTLQASFNKELLLFFSRGFICCFLFLDR